MTLIKLRTRDAWADLEWGEIRTLAELPEPAWIIAREAEIGSTLVLGPRGWALYEPEDDAA